MDNKTQSNGHLGLKRYDKDSYAMDYSGTTILTSLNNYKKLTDENERLKLENKSLNQELRNIKRHIQESKRKQKERIEKLITRYKNLQDVYEITKAKLEKFTTPNPRIKFTDEMKHMSLQARAKGHSIAEIHHALIQRGADISYETVRRYLSEATNSIK